MKWYGEPLEDYRVRLTKTLPPYTEDSEVVQLFNAIENKYTHKGCIVRDTLLVSLALKSGLRRAELANLASFLVMGRDARDKSLHNLVVEVEGLRKELGRLHRSEV